MKRTPDSGTDSALDPASGFRRAQAAAVLLAALAAIAVQIHLPLPLRAPLGYLLIGVIPGWLLAQSLLRTKGVTPEEKAMASLALSIPIAILGRALAFRAGFPPSTYVWVWAAACSVWAMLLRPPARRGPRIDRPAWAIVGALALLVAIPAGFNHVIRVYGDAMFHAQIVKEIALRGLPPQDPSFAGMPLTYMWQFHVWAVALTETMGLSPYEVFPWVGGAMMAALGFGACRVASLFWVERRYRRLAPAVVALGMNALGWVLLAGHTFVSPLVGANHGMVEWRGQISAMLLHPNGNAVCIALIYNSYFILCSLLFKFFCANALGAGLTLIVATFALTAAYLREGGRGRLVGLAIAGMSAAVIHPLVGVPAAACLFAGLALAGAGAEGRAAALRAAVAMAVGLLAGAVVIAWMLSVGLRGGEPTRFHLVRLNLLPLMQGLSVVLLPAIWGWLAARRRSNVLARFGLGFALASIALALVLDLPYVGEAYLVYVAYLGVAFFAAAGVAAAIAWMTRRIGAVPAWALVVLVFVPSALLMFNGFARQSESWGLAGYPETHDEIATFDWVRDHTPVNAIVIDSQYFSSSSVAAYAGRRGWFGGMRQVELVGYPRVEMAARGRAVANLLLGPGLRDSTWQMLRAVRAPLFIVARRTPPRDLVTAPPAGPAVDAIAKLDRLATVFEAVHRTPTLAVYRLVDEGRQANSP